MSNAIQIIVSKRFLGEAASVDDVDSVVEQIHRRITGHPNTNSRQVIVNVRDLAEAYRIVEDHSLPHVRDIVEDVYAEAMGENSASKDDVSPRSWETVTTFVATFPTEDGEGESVVEVQVGEGRGAWFVRTRDNDGGSDEAEDTAHPTYEAAVAAAKAMAAR